MFCRVSSAPLLLHEMDFALFDLNGQIDTGESMYDTLSVFDSASACSGGQHSISLEQSTRPLCT